ncbi:MAG: beta-galactosidase [Clostridia bacterium]|nr:beta-galactosidase [Clostridia bacterium]
MVKYEPEVFLHGGDYNPDQWLDYPEILEKDIALMQQAHVNAVSLGIFSWALLEKEEGVYDFSWMDRIVERLTEAGIGIILATPSGARPAWLAQKYPEVLRCNERFVRQHFGRRHNHCLTSPVYREKVRAMDTALAQHYGRHTGVKLWHIGNEFGGYCYCPLCADAFREFLKEKYGTLDALNARWWTGFWSQRYTAWAQIEPPSSEGQDSNPSMMLDWRRFETEQCRSFIAMERDAVQSVNPDIPVTINLMEGFLDYDYFALQEAVDVVSWDSYPEWGSGDDVATAASTAFYHDLMRSLKSQPFLLMESTPSQVNWKPHNKLKRPGMHMLASLQSVAHGSQSVLMFQWRKGRGGAEAFHGAVVSHDGRSDTRVFRDVEAVGETLQKIPEILSATVKARACVIYDYENRWALEGVEAAQKGHMQYLETVMSMHRALWEKGVSVDVRDMREETDLSDYSLVVAPLLFMFRNGFEDKLRVFVEKGGTLLMTYFSGIVDGDRLTFLGDAPHGLTEVLGLRAEEIDALYPQDQNTCVLSDGTCCTVRELCEIPRDVTAQVIGRYGNDFYAGLPCLTVHSYGKGRAWYLGAKLSQTDLMRVMERVCGETDLAAAWNTPLPYGVIASRRGDYVFLQNFSGREQKIECSGTFRDIVNGQCVTDTCMLPVNGIMILKKA